MITLSFPIQGGDYDRAGLASEGLKKRLKRIGLPPEVMRRAMIACYEAETNVVIHAQQGALHAVVENDRLHILVSDEGPGIQDVDQAMQEGFSTAPEEAVKLGFGAGMGLPNIRANSDDFSIESVPGQGTRLTMTLALNGEGPLDVVRHCVRTAVETCQGCLRCLTICPVHAIRVRGDRPQILDGVCVDCGQCLAVCPSRAFRTQVDFTLPLPAEKSILVLPASCLMDAAPKRSARDNLEALRKAGFRDIRLFESWEEALREEAVRFSETRPAARPVIVPTCPSIVQLIESRFPSLIDHIAPFLTPVEAAHRELEHRNVWWVPACPSQANGLSRFESEGKRLVEMSTVREMLFHVAGKGEESQHRAGSVQGRTPGLEETSQAQRRGKEILRVHGISHSVRVLEAMENGRLSDVPLVEPLACEQGSFGSPFLKMDPFPARYRWEREEIPMDPRARAYRRELPYRARKGLRLDNDMKRAIEKLSRIDEITKELPGKDCVQCGSPSCAALAEDIVLGRSAMEACPYVKKGRER